MNTAISKSSVTIASVEKTQALPLTGIWIGSKSFSMTHAFVIGLPVNMDGSSGPRVQATRAFVRSMSEKTEIPFVFWDERLSTVAAERALLEMDVSRAKRSERIDSAAASFILQGALDRLSALARASDNSADFS